MIYGFARMRFLLASFVGRVVEPIQLVISGPLGTPIPRFLNPPSLGATSRGVSLFGGRVSAPLDSLAGYSQA